MTDYGILGICFVVLYFLGYASSTLLTVGIILVMVSTYVSHIRYSSLINLLILIYFGPTDEE